MAITSRSSALAIGYCFPILSAILIALRFWARSHRKTGVFLDDWLTIPSWLAVTSACASLLTGLYKDIYSADTNIFDPKVDQEIYQITNAVQLSYVFAAFFVKLSILFFYRRIFRGKAFNFLSWTLIAITFIWGVYAFLADLLSCGKHVHAAFEGPWTICDSWGNRLQVASFFIDAFIDLGVLILPMPFVWKLQMSVARRLGLVFVFLVGGLAFVASLNNAVIQYLSDSATTLDIEGVTTELPQIIALFVIEWGIIEIGVALIACNLPTLSFLWAQGLPKQMASTARKSMMGLRYAVNKIVPPSRSRKASDDTAESGEGLVATQPPKISEGNDDWRQKLRRIMDEKLSLSRVMRSNFSRGDTMQHSAADMEEGREKNTSTITTKMSPPS